jgi:carbonic anhydrase
MLATPQIAPFRGSMTEPPHSDNKVNWLGLREAARRIGISSSTADYLVRIAEEDDPRIVWRPRPRTVLIDEALFVAWYASRYPDWKDPRG